MIKPGSLVQMIEHFGAADLIIAIKFKLPIPDINSIYTCKKVWREGKETVMSVEELPFICPIDGGEGGFLIECWREIQPPMDVKSFIEDIEFEEVH
jgi:hypothetical protein